MRGGCGEAEHFPVPLQQLLLVAGRGDVLLTALLAPAPPPLHHLQVVVHGCGAPVAAVVDGAGSHGVAGPVELAARQEGEDTLLPSSRPSNRDARLQPNNDYQPNI